MLGRVTIQLTSFERILIFGQSSSVSGMICACQALDNGAIWYCIAHRRTSKHNQT